MARFKTILQHMMKWGTDNPQIEYVGWGKVSEIQNLATYPALYFTPTPSIIEQNEHIIKFDIYFLDKMRHDKENELDIYDSMRLLAIDFLSYYDINWFHNNEFYVQYPATYDHVDGELEDFVSGIILSVEVHTNYNIDCLASNLNG